MLSTILVEYPWITTVALVVLVVLGPLVGAWLVPNVPMTRVLLTVSIGAVALLTLVPTSRDLAVGCATEWDLPTLGAVELMANLTLFAPIVLLAGVLTRRPLVALVVASGASAVVEAVQAFATVLGRSCSTNDWLSNTLGSLLGAGLAAAALRLADPLTSVGQEGAPSGRIGS
ncbi:VanZ family protein [Nocardioides panacis]|uniref:VanZ family protein n=1 Tax=Nocardioides panacis TaxID=2849501 RepID=A0A975T3B3_9ACTN|nr:VanZ family protein [Nocardioides panacis]QWZ10098.1 VanZ family protein [Nocardioides panacis]